MIPLSLSIILKDRKDKVLPRTIQGLNKYEEHEYILAAKDINTIPM